jgi:4'-phosphopantetheinyl transferase EntD
MESINVEGLPEPVARAVQAMVQALREQLAHDQQKAPRELPVWPGTVIGSLTREEIYDDVA